MDDSDGGERRKNVKGTRRQDDQFCALHNLLWDHHDHDSNVYKSTLCGKIKEIATTVRSMTPKWVFVLCISASFAFSIILFGITTNIIKNGQDDIKSSLADIKQSVAQQNSDELALKETMHQMKVSLTAIEVRLTALEKRIGP